MSLELRYLVLTFASTHRVLAAEAELRKRGIETEFIPVPREIDSSCGFCLRLPLVRGMDGARGALRLGVDLDIEAGWAIYEGRSWKERRYERIDENA